MENHRCKICFRSFVNRKALAGHMRSHSMNISSFSSSSSSSEEYDDDEEEKTGVLCSSFAVLEDRGSEIDSSNKNSVCRRSKRVRETRISDLNRLEVDGTFEEKKPKFDEKDRKGEIFEYSSPSLDPESLSSSVSETTSPERYGAYCLIMLSRDKWRRDEAERPVEANEEKKIEERDYPEDSAEEKGIKNKLKKCYRCEICSKSFRSFQALGGHKASHNKIKVKTEDLIGGGRRWREAAEEKLVECPFCPRVFTSGQAFGGHKRTHFLAATATKTTGPAKSFSKDGELLNIDLNLPASFDHGECLT